MRLLTLLIGALLPLQVWASEIEGPTEVKAGELVILSSEGIAASGRNWKAVNATEDSYVVVDQAKRLVFSTPQAGKYWFVFSYTVDLSDELEALNEAQDALGKALLVADLEEVKTASEALTEIISIVVETKVQTESIIHQVVVEGGSDPTPEPFDPDDKPVPLPEGKYGLASVSRDLALQKVPEAVRGRSKDVAGAHRAVAAQIAAGALKGGEEPILIALRDKLVSTLGKDFEAWKPWGNASMEALSTISDEGNLKTDQDFATAFSELALGLEVIQ